MTESSQVMIFTRYPEPGKTKTRLIPTLGAKGAARLQRRMTEHIVTEALALARQRLLAVSVHYEGGNRRCMTRWLGKGLIFHRQVSGDLGRRMLYAFRKAFDGGIRRGILAGSDIPKLDRTIMEQALDHLDKQDLVLGPARDGGYYLIGMNQALLVHSGARLFGSLPWGTGEVLTQTLKAAHRAGLSFRLLPPLNDVDRPADLALVEGEFIDRTR